jgi:hypothetical protein
MDPTLEQDKSPPIMMKSNGFFFIHFFILMVILDILKYKGKKLILIEKNFFTFCLLLLTFIFI